jgi:hypothetical protein
MRMIALLLPIAASLACAENSGGVRYPITETVVANFLRANGISVTSSEVTLPMKLTATTSEPQLEIAATRRIHDGQLRLELRCRRVGECVAFDAILDVDDAKLIRGEMDSELPSSKSVSEENLGSTTRLATLRNDSVSHGTFHLRIGAQVVLVIEDAQMQIHLPVIAMDSGSIGSLVRVSTLDRKKVFRALVEDAGLVKGVIE